LGRWPCHRCSATLGRLLRTPTLTESTCVGRCVPSTCEGIARDIDGMTMKPCKRWSCNVFGPLAVGSHKALHPCSRDMLNEVVLSAPDSRSVIAKDTFVIGDYSRQGYQFDCCCRNSSWNWWYIRSLNVVMIASGVLNS